MCQKCIKSMTDMLSKMMNLIKDHFNIRCYILKDTIKNYIKVYATE